VNRTFSVSTIGVPTKELYLLRAICALSKSRSARFEVADEKLSGNTDIIVVNQDDAVAMANWHSAYTDQQGKPTHPTIRLTSHDPQDDDRYYIKKPLIVTRVLGLLDQITMKELDFEQELAFDDNTKSELSTNAKKSGEASSQSKELNYRALVVDDSLPVRIQMDLVLKPFVDHIDFAESGEKAIYFMENETYDIIFLDVILPGADGYEICKKIKSNEIKKNTPVIMLTGNSSPADQVKGRLAGCDTYLIKPVKSDMFKEVVKEYLH
jgi:CheY-like chemotaxis protein